VVCESCGRPIEWISGGTRLLYDSVAPGKSAIGVLEIAARKGRLLLEHPQNALSSPHVSPDGRFLLFTEITGGRTRRIHTAPFTGEPVSGKDWTLLVDGKDFDRQPFWAPSGKLVYFLSDRDAARCIWAQPVDPATGRPAGQAFGVHHFHEVRYPLEYLGDPGRAGLSVAGGYMFFAAPELQSNVWVAERRRAESNPR
jgi:hypothetical protein